VVKSLGLTMSFRKTTARKSQPADVSVINDLANSATSKVIRKRHEALVANRFVEHHAGDRLIVRLIRKRKSQRDRMWAKLQV
jgi:hypothetical protein